VPHVDCGYLAGGIFVETAGAGPAVVLTHDGLLHRETWDAQFATFTQRYRVARWDRRGYGRSATPESPYSSIQDLAQVARSVSDGPATLIGCSFGGLLSLHCALDHPQLVTALVLVGPIVSGLGFTEHFISRGGRAPAQDAPVAEQIDYWTRTDPWIVHPANGDARRRLRALLTANPQNLQPPVQLEQRPQVVALGRLGEISVPTLIVVGEGDIPDVHAHCGAIQAGIPGAGRVVMSGCGHLPHLEAADTFNQVVLEFIGSHRR
jgi:3-oxoadipate enol-lactonase